MNKAWWKESVVYQIYPRSFKDTFGDGIGDIPGIISKLDYLEDLGVDVIWLSPVYESPNVDFGYDVSDYRKILGVFGTMADWEEMMEEIHKRGMKLIMDLVVNHTSDQHPWFIESRKSKDNPYHDYYIWRPGKEDGPPTDWFSNFGGSAWSYDENIGEYFLHLFAKEQPDLNWENPEVRKEIHDMMGWWLDKGVDGFRMDVINFIAKPEKYRDIHEKTTKHYATEEQLYGYNPKIHDYFKEMNREVFSKYDIMTVGEMPGVTPEHARIYTDEKEEEIDMVFQFEHMELDSGPYGKWDVEPLDFLGLKKNFSKWQEALEEVGWNSLYFNNHDQPRSVSRFGNDKTFRNESAKMLATILLMMRGTPFIYQGEELGMTNVKFDLIEDYRDIETLNFYQEQLEEQVPEAEIMQSIHAKGRDNARTPMQWDDSEHAGFTTGKPWLKVNPNYKEINAEQAVSDENSVYHYYRKLIELRKKYEIVVYGNYDLLLENHPEIFAYKRKLKEETLLVICNFYEGNPEFSLPEDLIGKQKELLLSNYAAEEGILKEQFNLRPYETRIYLMK